MEMSDLSGPEPDDPQEALALDAEKGEAERGFDILEIARPASWAVCKLCDRPAVVQGTRSRCCRAPIRIQGWHLPAVCAR